MRFGHCAIALGLLTLTVRAGAQTMPEKVPADALVYVGWEGSVALGKSYDASHLKGMIDALGLKEYIAAALQKQQQGRDAAKLEQEQLAQDLFTAVSKSPTVFYCGPFDFSVQPPRPRIAVFSKVGAADATALAARLNKAAKDSTDPKKQPTEASAEQEMLTVLVGDAADLKTRLAGAKEHSLSTLKEFQDAMNSLSGAKHEQAPACVFINAELALQSINEGVAASDNAQARMGWPKVVDALGLDAIRNMAWIGRFDGADWTNDSLVSFTAKRSGLAGFLDNKPLSADALKMIPKNATVASVIRFDGVRLLNDIRAAATRADERGAQIFDAGLNQLFFFTGVDFQKDLLPALSDEFVIYAAPDADGKSVRGLTLVNTGQSHSQV